MSSLLERARKINRLLQRSENVEYDSISRVLCNVIDANVYITNKQGKVFGYAFVDDFECDMMVDKVINHGEFPRNYVKWLLKIDETSPNLRTNTGMCAFSSDETMCKFNGKNTTVVPIYGVGERIGTLILAKYGDEFTDDDLLLAEYGATVVGMEMLRDNTQKIEIEARDKATVQIALSTLSYSEIAAAIAIFDEMEKIPKENERRRKEILKREEEIDRLKKENKLEEAEEKNRLLKKDIKNPDKLKIKELVASKVADDLHITRSVIVNALRKFESAGLIESKSLGMKGTKIKVLNDHLLEELKKNKMKEQIVGKQE